jgi:hypothetical protein
MLHTDGWAPPWSLWHAQQQCLRVLIHAFTDVHMFSFCPLFSCSAVLVCLILCLNVAQSVSPVLLYFFIFFFAPFSTDPPLTLHLKRLNHSCTCSSHLHLHFTSIHHCRHIELPSSLVRVCACACGVCAGVVPCVGVCVCTYITILVPSCADESRMYSKPWCGLTRSILPLSLHLLVFSSNLVLHTVHFYLNSLYISQSILFTISQIQCFNNIQLCRSLSFLYILHLGSI